METVEEKKIPEDIKLATFGNRVWASFLDSLIFIPVAMVSLYNIIYVKVFMIECFVIAFYVFYKVYMEWKFGATFGKMIARIRVVNSEWKGITIEQSFVRFCFYFLMYATGLIINYQYFNHEEFAAIDTLDKHMEFTPQTNWQDIQLIGLMTLMFSVMFVLYDPYRQALHDKFASTYCVSDR